MEYMGIVECASSARLYVDDIIMHGYKPLIINPKGVSEFYLSYREMMSKEIGDKAEYIDEDEDFDVFIEKLKGYNLKAVFIGSDSGVRLADRINKALGLKGNDPATSYLRVTKKGMYEALGKAGIRRIESRVVTCDNDIREFWNEYALDKCVLKFSEGAGTVGIKICKTIEEAIEHYRYMLGAESLIPTDEHTILIQEYIGGTEYIVNTLSCDGKHMVTDMWRYNKVTGDDGSILYDHVMLLKDLEPGHSDMVQYAYRVLDAVDMKWGISHIEIKIDRKGPVLIETNVRPMGLAMTQAYLDEALGYHQTDLAVDVYLDPSMFSRYARKVYNPLKYALMKLMIVPEDMVGSFEPIFILSNMIKSTREVLFFGKDGINSYARTIDLETSPLAIKMINSDYGALMKDYELLRIAEKRYFHLFYTLGEDLEPQKLTTNINRILDLSDRNKKILVVTDDGQYAWQYGQRIETDGQEVYDGALYAVCKGQKAEERYRQIFRTIRNIRSGGPFVAVPESYRSMTYGSVAMDFLMNIGGVRIILPAYEANDVVYGVKK